MRRVHVSRGHSRSRSRSPLLRGPRAVVSKTQPVNMLDQATLLAVRSKKETKPTTPKERITCTIDGPRRSGPISSRTSGGFHPIDRRRSDPERHAGFQNRQTMRDRLSFGDRRGRERYDAMRDTDSSRFNGKFRDEDADKPVQRLIDPTTVPKGKGYFGHDDRGEEKQWRGRNAYDPRIDMGPRRDRFNGNRGYGSREKFERRDRDRDRDAPPRRSFSSRSAADGVWTHDKYIELEGEEESDNERGGVEVVVDQRTSAKSRRLIKEDEDEGSGMMLVSPFLMDDEVDDYMSDSILNASKDVKPGLAKNREHKRWLKMQEEKHKSRPEERHVPKKKHELEKTLREEALNKPVPESSKGFALLAKMGFKPGMSLGKKKHENDLGSGIKEPIPVEVKASRAGLGHESDIENQAKLRLKQEMERMKRRAEHHVELLDDYRKRKRGFSNTKDLIRDILSSRKICAELDLRMDLELPTQSWFWKSYPERTQKEYGVRFGSAEPEDSGERRFTYANGREAPEEQRFDELPDEALQERLEIITCYLRETHRYCIWCGCQFENCEELNSYCPGQDRQAHDSIDE
ncbi:hypothetical protein Q1695_002077 [Nippostrongylus brasiliensis]|nr:hypothetical protein Q1695_002077 [Nippostrongylus brasiliensis]